MLWHRSRLTVVSREAKKEKKKKKEERANCELVAKNKARRNSYCVSFTVDFIFIWTFRASREPLFCGENQPLEVRISRKPITRRQWLVFKQSVHLPVAGFCYGGSRRTSWNVQTKMKSTVHKQTFLWYGVITTCSQYLSSRVNFKPTL